MVSLHFLNLKLNELRWFSLHKKFRKMSAVSKVVQLEAAICYDKTSPLVSLFTIKNKAVSTQKLLFAVQWILFFMTKFWGA